MSSSPSVRRPSVGNEKSPGGVSANISPGGVVSNAGDDEAKQVELLMTEPGSRSMEQVESIADLISKQAPEFAAPFADEQIVEVAKTGHYHFFNAGDRVCDADEECEYFFIVLRGAVQIEEKQVHHQEDGLSGGAVGAMRVTTCGAGHGFHHFPLVMQHTFYGYSASVVESSGAAVLLIPKNDYQQHLRRWIDKEMSETVSMLKATTFFSSWSELSISRLYFWLVKRKYAVEEDVVRQGDEADFCFIIRSGRCDVLVELSEEEGKPAQPPDSGYESASPWPSPINQRAGPPLAAEGGSPPPQAAPPPPRAEEGGATRR